LYHLAYLFKLDIIYRR